VAGPPLLEYESAKAQRWDTTTPDGSRLAACLDVVTASARPFGELTQAALWQFHALLLDGQAGTELRQGIGTHLSEGHVCLDPAAVSRALARFFEWTASQAFAEMHALEQMTLCQVRLYEIWPFERYSGPATDFFCLRALYLKTCILPLLEVGDMSNFQEALSEAFGFVTKPLVDFYLRACERTCDQVLGQL
jgi:hypothetical protein